MGHYPPSYLLNLTHVGPKCAIGGNSNIVLYYMNNKSRLLVLQDHKWTFSISVMISGHQESPALSYNSNTFADYLIKCGTKCGLSYIVKYLLRALPPGFPTEFFYWDVNTRQNHNTTCRFHSKLCTARKLYKCRCSM